MSASLFDASIYPDSWFNKHCYYGGMFDKNRVYSTRLALHGVNTGNAKGNLVRAHHRASGALSGTAISNSTTGEWVMPVTLTENHFATCVGATTEPLSVADSRDLVCRIPMNGTNGSTKFYDVTGKTECIPLGGLSITTAVADPFGGYSGVADISTESRQLLIVSPFSVSPNGFSSPRSYTVRFWIYLKTLNASAYASIVNIGTASGSVGFGRNIATSNGAIINNGVGITLGATGLPTTNQWVHLEFNRSTSAASTTNRIFYGGALNASGSTVSDYSAEIFTITFGGAWTGYACDFQLFASTKNTAAYTVPTARVPFSLSTPTVFPLVEDDIKPL